MDKKIRDVHCSHLQVTTIISTTIVIIFIYYISYCIGIFEVQREFSEPRIKYTPSKSIDLL